MLGPHSPVGQLLRTARHAVIESLQSDLGGAPIDPADPRLGEYLMASMGSLAEEVLRILFLDGASRLIADEQVQWGTLDQLAVYPRTIFRRAMEHNAAGIILVHNHPSGDPSPSPRDVKVTRMLIELGRSLDISVVDHIIVTSGEWRRVPAAAAARQGAGGRMLRDPAGASIDDGETAERDALANAKRTVRRRMLRRQLVGASWLFGEPAWDMLIDLFVHELEEKPVATSSLCLASGVPMSSALRLVQRLCDAKLIQRHADPRDGRRSFVRLSPDLRRRLTAYFAMQND